MSAESQAQTAPERLSVTVCIATFRRPDGLRDLLRSLDELDCDEARADISLVIAENCPECPAEAVLGDIQSLTRWPVRYVHEPVRGIVSARNRCLEELPGDTDLVAFLDDDETVSPQWLHEMVGTFRETGATALQGPVVPQYEVPAPDWIDQSGVFRMGPYEQGQILPSAATNNSVVDAAIFLKMGYRFDMRFNTTGGEDEELFGRVAAANGVIRAAAEAVVFDCVPASRMTLKWLARRSFRKGNTLGRIAILRKKRVALRGAKGFAAMAWGAGIVLVLGLGSRVRLIRGLLEICRGAGMISAFLNISFQEYSRAAVVVDRRESH